ncbi:exodeoxyribonuclease III [Thermodesulfobacterium sp. TA1]|uniref:exodeoxyribonuclease III n=1 Tax=Thermodesulfobacterium sp. TA1 TaxID=2234087 RepID=UPI001231E0C1|nr:exodeoxyribonuclease III [Thermodesulfobacterium sp. TA1]QER41366.1 exodeoxyribonuclease III [Thermodesulfobacterium sp. TA1]
MVKSFKMLVATWNVNSIKTRKDQVFEFLKEVSPDLLALQETKVKTEEFPYNLYQEIGYYVVHSGGKGRNGVALLTKFVPQEIKQGFEGIEGAESFPDAVERLVGIKVEISGFSTLWVFSVYVPNGGQPESDYYYYKISFFWRLKEFFEKNFSPQDHIILMGDFNVAPENQDVFDPVLFEGHICFTEKEKKAFFELLSFGFYDALRFKHPEAKRVFTWWDYQFGAFKKDQGMRLDHILITQPILERLVEVYVEKKYRAKAKPSDHAPVIAKFLF